MNADFILLDLDGTLTDPKEGITKSFKYALESYGIEVPELDSLAKYIGPPLRSSFMEGYGFSSEQTENAIIKWRVYFSERGMFENKLYPGVPELLRELSEAGKTLALVTSKVASFAEKILEHFNIRQYFKFISGDELDGSRSDKSELIQYAFENLPGINRENSVMVGDRNYDINGEKSAGIRSIGVLYGYDSPAELQATGADHLVSNVAELNTLLLSK